MPIYLSSLQLSNYNEDKFQRYHPISLILKGYIEFLVTIIRELRIKMRCLPMRLKSVAKRGAKWVLPPAIESLLKIHLGNVIKLKYSISKEYRGEFKKIDKFRDIHLGKRCFILATGPSILKQDLKVLKSEHCIAVGFMALHKDIQIINPMYHVEAPCHNPFDFKTLNSSYENFKNYSKEVTYFLGHSSYKYSHWNYLKEREDINLENFYHINYAGCTYIDEYNYKNQNIWDISKSPFAVRTVVYIAIQIAVFMGFKEIYLLGCDHDYLQDMDRVRDHHFYEDKESGVSDAEHLSEFSTERWLEQYFYRWKEYRLMKEYLVGNGCNVFNATEGGMLDVFPRVTLSDAISTRNQRL
jgi:hypothetical protein